MTGRSMGPLDWREDRSDGFSMQSEDWFSPSAPLQERQRRFRRKLTITGYGVLAAAFVLLLLRDHISNVALAIYAVVLLLVLAAWFVWGIAMTVRHAVEGRKEVRQWKATRDPRGRAREPDTRS